MAQRQLPARHSRRALILGLGPLALGLAACAQAGGNQERPVGLTLLFLNVGSESIGVKRFDPDGQRGPVPGALGAGGGGAQMTFMPGDSKRGLPRFVEVEWTQETAESKAMFERLQQPKGMVSKEAWSTYTQQLDEVYKKGLRYTRRIDLTPILTPELLARIRANPKSGNVKLTVTFNNYQVSIEAQAEKLR
jgi:hypothetical protein